MVPGERRLLAIGYKYNSQKVLYFIAAEGAGEHYIRYYLFIEVS